MSVVAPSSSLKMVFGNKRPLPQRQKKRPKLKSTGRVNGSVRTVVTYITGYVCVVLSSGKDSRLHTFSHNILMLF